MEYLVFKEQFLKRVLLKEKFLKMLIKPTEHSVSRAEICSITKKVTKGYMWVTVRFDFMPYFFYNFYGATR